MFSIRNVMRPFGQRSIGYLHKGSRVRGLVRDESEYLKNPKGLKYELNESNVKSLKEFLGEEYKLPNELILQILTHKSFAHGLKPFNEKLSVYGLHFLKYKTTLFTIGESNEVEKLGTEASKSLNSTLVLAEFLRSQKSNIIDSIFWKKRDPLLTNPKQNGENSIYATTTNAIVGGILLHYGKLKANKFVDEVLLKENDENSLVGISKRV